MKGFSQEGSLTGEFEIDGGAYPNAELYKSPDGFILVNMVRKGAMSAKILYEIVSLGNDMSVNWRLKIDDESIREVVDVLATEEGIALIYTSGKGMKKENYGQHLMRLSNEGKVVFDEVFANNYYYFPNKILVDEENTFIFGSYPKEGKSKPVGVFAIGFDADGEMTVKKELEYESKISPEIKKIMSDYDVNMKEAPQFIVNDAIKTEQGFHIITETVQLRPALGAAVQVSTGGSGGSISVNTTFIMGDFIILNLDPQLELEKVKVVTKKTNKVTMEGTVFNVNQYHHVLKQNNVSNYQYWVTNDEGNPTMIYTIRKNFRSNIQVGAVDITSNEDVSETKPMESDLEKLKELGYFGVLKGSDNQLTVYTYKKRVFSFYKLTYTM